MVHVQVRSLSVKTKKQICAKQRTFYLHFLMTYFFFRNRHALWYPSSTQCYFFTGINEASHFFVGRSISLSRAYSLALVFLDQSNTYAGQVIRFQISHNTGTALDHSARNTKLTRPHISSFRINLTLFENLQNMLIQKYIEPVKQVLQNIF